jgi:hypothetical protein
MEANRFCIVCENDIKLYSNYVLQHQSAATRRKTTATRHGYAKAIWNAKAARNFNGPESARATGNWQMPPEIAKARSPTMANPSPCSICYSVRSGAFVAIQSSCASDPEYRTQWYPPVA